MSRPAFLRAFLLGAATTAAVIAGFGTLVVGLGLAPTEASTAPSRLEAGIVGTALDAAMRRRAAHLQPPSDPTEADLMQGMFIYKTGCAACHGLPWQADNPYGRSFYPPAPQFAHQPPRRSQGELYYLVKHGVRMTGMAAWGNVMEEEQMWKVSAFLHRLPSLPAPVESEWRKPPQ